MVISYTTIKVSKKTLKQLDKLKKRFCSRIYEETILRHTEEYKSFGVDREE